MGHHDERVGVLLPGSMRLVWAQRVEDLAEGLYGEMERSLEGDPFAQAAVVGG